MPENAGDVLEWMGNASTSFTVPLRSISRTYSAPQICQFTDDNESEISSPPRFLRPIPLYFFSVGTTGRFGLGWPHMALGPSPPHCTFGNSSAIAPPDEPTTAKTSSQPHFLNGPLPQTL